EYYMIILFFWLVTWQPDRVRVPLAAHLAGALELTPLFDLQDRRRDAPRHASVGEELDALRRAHAAAQRAVDRDPFDRDLGDHVGRVSEDQLRAGPDLPLEPA